MRQGDSTVDDFYAQMSAVWRQLDSIGPPLSPSTCDSCKAQKVALETRRTYDILSRLRDEFEQLRAQLVSRVPCVSLMEALATVRNEELCLRSAGLLQSSSSSVLAARSSSSTAVTPPPKVPLSAASSSEGGGVVVFTVTIVVRKLMWRHFASRRRKISLAEVVVVVLHRVQVVLVVLILEALSGVLLVLRHRRCSCCFVASLPLRLWELLVLLLSPLHS